MRLDIGVGPPVLGDAGVIAAVGVISNFERMNRIADATGIPLDAGRPRSRRTCAPNWT